jgi:hypothetical protein
MCHYLTSNYYFNGIYCHNKHHIFYIVQCNGWNHNVNLTQMSTKRGFMCEKNHVLLYWKTAHMDSEVLLPETQLWADPEVLALELTFRNCCQFSKFPHITFEKIALEETHFGFEVSFHEHLIRCCEFHTSVHTWIS